MVEVRAQLGAPGVECAAEPGQLRDRALAQVGDQLLGAGPGLVGVLEPVEVHQVLGHGPGQGDFAVRVAGDQPGLQPGVGDDRQSVAAATKQPADAVERIFGAAAVAQGVVLHAAADVIDTGQAQAHDVERVEHPHRVGQLRGQGAGVAPERVQRRRRHRSPPRLCLVSEPVGQHAAGAALDHVE
jgi:hypothetical protein